MKKLITLLSFLFVINSTFAAITLTPTAIDTGYCQNTYSCKVTATGGTGPYAYTVSVGSLPTGLFLNKGTGVISGTLLAYTNATSVSFTIKATDAINANGTRAYTMYIVNKVVTWEEIVSVWNRMPNTYPTKGDVYNTWRLSIPNSSTAGTSGKYAKFNSSGALTNALLNDAGNFVRLPSGKNIGSQDTTKSLISFGTTGAEGINIATTGNLDLSSSGALGVSSGGDISFSTTERTTISSDSTFYLQVNHDLIVNSSSDLLMTISDSVHLSTNGKANLLFGNDLVFSSNGSIDYLANDSSNFIFQNDARFDVDGVSHFELDGNSTFNGGAKITIQASDSLILGGPLVALNKIINTTAGDAATINASAGRFRKDASGASFVLTNSYINANSIIVLTPANAAVDATGTVFTVLAGSGDATITWVAAPAGNFDMNFFIIN